MRSSLRRVCRKDAKPASRPLWDAQKLSTWIRCARSVVLSMALLAGESGRAPAATLQSEEQVPSFAELQDAGALVGKITINNQNVFDLADPEENNF
ncbi:MAG: hypothetical protein ABI619_11560, partial [Betaproteobacteria bacterium]